MNVFTVTKPGGTKDYEFEAYTSLLEEIGVEYTWYQKQNDNSNPNWEVTV